MNMENMRVLEMFFSTKYEINKIQKTNIKLIKR